MIEYVEDRLGHDRRYSIDTTKVARPRLGARREFHEALTGRSSGTATTAGGGSRSSQAEVSLTASGRRLHRVRAEPEALLPGADDDLLEPGSLEVRPDLVGRR